jgi:DNA-binding HxlR family transcriptional regulator
MGDCFSTHRACCPRYHAAIELIGRRWSGAILRVLADGPLRFSEIGHAVPELSDRLLSERMKELEARGLLARRCSERTGTESRRVVSYELTDAGRALQPALDAVQHWARRWLPDHAAG